ADNAVALAKRGIARAHDLADDPALDHGAEFDRRGIGAHAADAPAHVRVEREIDPAHQHPRRPAGRAAAHRRSRNPPYSACRLAADPVGTGSVERRAELGGAVIEAGGETVVISAATGAVGAIVGQLAKRTCARVVGIAGGADKCRYAEA